MKIIDNLKNRVDLKFIATFFLTLIAVTISSAAILFLLGSHINGFLFIIDYLLTTGLMYVIYKKKYSTKKIIDNVFITIIIFFILCTIATIFYDFSYDGNDYHKQMIGLMKNGVNPMYNYQSGNIWTNHYANGSEIWGAVLYAFTDNIETGKVINLLLAFALCFISFDYINKKSNRPILSCLLSIALAFNPIVLAQFHTYYIDGIVALSLITIIVALLRIIDGEQNFNDKANYLILASSIIICVNAKYTALLLAMMFVGLLGGFTFFYNLVKKNNKFAWQYFALIACVFAFAVGLVGSSSYVKNTLTHGNPFYPLRGEGAVNIEGSEPELFGEYSNTKKWLYGTFSKSYTWYDQEPELKIPFTIYRSEFDSIQYPDTRFGGLGMWYSGMFIISMVVILIALLVMIKNKVKEAWIVGILLAAILLPIPILPIVWQARYYPEMYLIPFIAVTILLTYKSDKFSLSKCLAYALIIMVMVNTSFYIPQVVQTARASNIANDSLTYLAEQSLTKKVIISPAGEDTFGGVYYNYIDKGIKYEYQQEPLEDAGLLYRGMLYKIVEENE